MLISLFVVLSFIFVGSFSMTYAQTDVTITSSMSAMGTHPLSKTVVTHLRPDNGSYVTTTNTPYILLRYKTTDESTLKNMSVIMDGHDVTRFATITSTYVGYSPPGPWALGDHVMKLVSVDRVGMNFGRYMVFTVEAQGPAVSHETVRIFDNATSPSQTGDTVTVTLLGRSNGVATFDVGTSKMGIPMKEVSPGTYTAAYTVDDGNSFNSATLTGHLSVPNGETFSTYSPSINNPAYYTSLAPENTSSIR